MCIKFDNYIIRFTKFRFQRSLYTSVFGKHRAWLINRCYALHTATNQTNVQPKQTYQSNFVNKEGQQMSAIILTSKRNCAIHRRIIWIISKLDSFYHSHHNRQESSCWKCDVYQLRGLKLLIQSLYLSNYTQKHPLVFITAVWQIGRTSALKKSSVLNYSNINH